MIRFLLLLSFIFALVLTSALAANSSESETRFVYVDQHGKVQSAEVISHYTGKLPKNPFPHLDPKLTRAATIAEERAHAHSRRACCPESGQESGPPSPTGAVRGCTETAPSPASSVASKAASDRIVSLDGGGVQGFPVRAGTGHGRAGFAQATGPTIGNRPPNGLTRRSGRTGRQIAFP